jgi:hypothetical protein
MHLFIFIFCKPSRAGVLLGPGKKEREERARKSCRVKRHLKAHTCAQHGIILANFVMVYFALKASLYRHSSFVISVFGIIPIPQASKFF